MTTKIWALPQEIAHNKSAYHYAEPRPTIAVEAQGQVSQAFHLTLYHQGRTIGMVVFELDPGGSKPNVYLELEDEVCVVLG